ncbi:hypothetical protein F5146DRAFT_272670 [Armillaria mellea]|nr:hypothetical protein F5146DRAFT_272670 [Armillaria mellea]
MTRTSIPKTKVDHQSVRIPYSSDGFKDSMMRRIIASAAVQPCATKYENALRSIEACTTKYGHLMKLAVLTGVGPTCIDRLTEKLEAYCELESIEMSEYWPKTKRRALPKKRESVQPTHTLKTGAEAIPTKKNNGEETQEQC